MLKILGWNSSLGTPMLPGLSKMRNVLVRECILEA